MPYFCRCPYSPAGRRSRTPPSRTSWSCPRPCRPTGDRPSAPSSRGLPNSPRPRCKTGSQRYDRRTGAAWRRTGPCSSSTTRRSCRLEKRGQEASTRAGRITSALALAVLVGVHVHLVLDVALKELGDLEEGLALLVDGGVALEELPGHAGQHQLHLLHLLRRLSLKVLLGPLRFRCEITLERAAEL